MCQGTTTTMSCGHIILHYKSRCQQSEETQELCKDLHGPKNLIDDTCHKCHPPHAICEINREYDELHGKLMAMLRSAKTGEAVTEIQKAVQEAHMQRGKELRAASRLRWNGIVVWVPTEDAREE
ncbi:hypothetical protein IFR04_015564 [Cadophora malorum]|uniref:Uncharacterized protein n=1 Tax=Cadophora malorum TaxID=108018 RepID=A0A8H7T2P8_9HELO|nr:hypothetical protein IFR04_015564 [Cadophora malorum]